MDVFRALYLKKVVLDSHLHVTEKQWDSFQSRLDIQLEDKREDYYDEQVWTGLMAVGYAMGEVYGARKLAELLTGNADLVSGHPGNGIWLEALPYPPREKEGNTNLDLAMGAIEERALGDGKDGNGIQFMKGSCDWICFCEMKWYSDISKDVTHDTHRNQLIRVIDNAISFQTADKYPSAVYVTLVTPSVFKDRSPKSRFYAYKFEEYTSDERNILKDLEACALDCRAHYPKNMEERLECLKLNWVTFEDLFKNIPESPLKSRISTFAAEYNQSRGIKK